MEFVTAKAISSDFVEDTGINPADTDMPIFIKWAEDKMSDMDMFETYEPNVDLIPIKGYKASRPPNAKIICEIAGKEKRDNDCNKELRIIGEQVVEWKEQINMEGCELQINLLCPNCHKSDCDCNSLGYSIDIDQAWLDARPEYYYRDMLHYQGKHTFGHGRSVHHPKFTLLKPSDSPWNEIQHLPDCANITCTQTCEDSYYITKNYINTPTIKEGWLLISYLGVCIDEDGNRVLEISNKDGIRAVVEHMKYKYFYRQYQKSREASDRALYIEAMQMSEEYESRYGSAIAVSQVDKLFGILMDTKSNRLSKSIEDIYQGKVPPQMNSNYQDYYNTYGKSPWRRSTGSPRGRHRQVHS